MSFAVLGGIFLNIGAFLTYKGKIYEAVLVYLVADLCWMVMAYVRDDWIGASFIIVGTILGFMAFLKMQKGDMKKNLNEKEKS